MKYMYSLLKRAGERLNKCRRNCGLLLWMLWKGANDMSMVYATLIIKGRRNFESVPEALKAQVREILIDCECGHLCGADNE